MKYIEQQRLKALSLVGSMFKDPCGGRFLGKEREFVLKNGRLNLHHSIAVAAEAYFKKHLIGFWHSYKGGPSGHLLSSQVACINHLFFARLNSNVATAILQGIDGSVSSAVAFADDGYVDFEVIGKANYLGEKEHTRGAKSTSIDAVMVGKMQDGTNKVFFIEWKYTESYTSLNKADGTSGATRVKTYSKLLSAPDCPLIANDVKALFIEPYYQLMRQTLLAYEMVKVLEFGATDYMHIHVIPTANKELKSVKTSARLPGTNLDSAWKAVLKQPQKYLTIDPESFLAPAKQYGEAKELLDYLQKRYWQ